MDIPKLRERPQPWDPGVQPVWLPIGRSPLARHLGEETNRKCAQKQRGRRKVLDHSWLPPPDLNGQQTITKASQKGLLSSHATHLLPIQPCPFLPLPECARLHDSARVCQHPRRHTVESSHRLCPQGGDMRHVPS